jgi:hypothetical protein
LVDARSVEPVEELVPAPHPDYPHWISGAGSPVRRGPCARGPWCDHLASSVSKSTARRSRCASTKQGHASRSTAMGKPRPPAAARTGRSRSRHRVPARIWMGLGGAEPVVEVVVVEPGAGTGVGHGDSDLCRGGSCRCASRDHRQSTQSTPDELPPATTHQSRRTQTEHATFEKAIPTPI